MQCAGGPANRPDGSGQRADHRHAHERRRELPRHRAGRHLRSERQSRFHGAGRRGHRRDLRRARGLGSEHSDADHRRDSELSHDRRQRQHDHVPGRPDHGDRDRRRLAQHIDHPAEHDQRAGGRQHRHLHRIDGGELRRRPRRQRQHGRHPGDAGRLDVRTRGPIRPRHHYCSDGHRRRPGHDRTRGRRHLYHRETVSRRPARRGVLHRAAIAAALIAAAWVAAAPVAARDVDGAAAALRAADPVRALALLGPLEAPAALSDNTLWVAAVAHKRAGNARAAVPLFAELVRRHPQDPAFRLELATALFETGQDARAAYHFDLARGAGLTASADRTAGAFLEALDRRRPLRTRLSFGIISDANPGRRTAAREIEIFGLPFTLDDDAVAQSATGLSFGAGLTWTPSLGGAWSGRTDLSVSYKLYDRAVPDEGILSAEQGVTRRTGNGGTVGVGGYLQARFLDRDSYWRESGAYLSFRMPMGPAAVLSGRVAHGWRGYARATALDGHRTEATLAYRRALTSQLVLTAQLAGERLESAYAPSAYETWSGSVGAEYAFEGGLIAGASLTHQRRRNGGIDPLFGVTRKDERTTLGLSLRHASFTIGDFAPVLILTGETQSSSIDLYDFEGLKVSFGLSRQF
ncbi:DUF560 domain-containing protein [Rhodobacteraceae bacterium CCMM004]|nr:DUF560 domain-containing protein [Rhodobacteraceae bacterium CCMM004]